MIEGAWLGLSLVAVFIRKPAYNPELDGSKRVYWIGRGVGAGLWGAIAGWSVATILKALL